MLKIHGNETKTNKKTPPSTSLLALAPPLQIMPCKGVGSVWKAQHPVKGVEGRFSSIQATSPCPSRVAEGEIAKCFHFKRTL